MPLSEERLAQILKRHGFDPGRLPDQEEMRQFLRPTLGERIGRRATEEATLGFIRQEVPEAETTAEVVADIIGSILGAAPAVIGTAATAGAPVGALAGRALARFGPRVAGLGQVLARETVGGAAFGALQGGAEALRGAPPEQVGRTIATEAGLGLAGGLAGEAIGAGFRAGRGLLRRAQTARQAQQAAQQTTTEITGLLPEITDTALREAREQALEQYTEDLRRFYQENPDLLQEAFEAHRQRAMADLDRAIAELRPEFERRVRARTLAPLKRDRMRRWLAEKLGVPLEEVERLGRRELEDLVRQFEQEAGGVRFRDIAREVARERGIDLDELIRAADAAPATPEEMLEYLVNRERMAIISGVKELPRFYLVDTATRSIRQGMVQQALTGPTRKVVAGTARRAKDALAEAAAVHPNPEVRAAAQHVQMVEQQVPQVLSRFVGEHDIAGDIWRMGRGSPLNPLHHDPAQMTEFQRGVGIAISSVETFLRRRGPAGQQLAGMLRVRESVRNRIRGELLARGVRDFARLSDKDAELVARILEGKQIQGPVPPHVQQMAQKIRQLLDEVGAAYEQMGAQMQVLDRSEDGEIVTRLVPFQRIQNYFPRLIDWSKVLEPNSTIFRREAVEKVAIAMSGRADERSMEAARRILETLFRRPDLQRNPLAFFQHARVATNIPDELLLPPKARLALWANAVAEQTANLQVFGAQGFERLFTTLRELGEQIPKNEARYIRVALERILGLEPDPGFFGDISQGIRNFNAIMDLTLAAIPNITQGPLAVALRYGTKTLVKALVDILRGVPRKELEEFAIRAGAIVDQEYIARELGELGSRGWLSGLASGALRFYGFTGTEVFNQLLATRAARIAAEDMFNNLRRALDDPQRVGWVDRIIGRQPERIRRQFLQAGVDIDAALQRGHLTEEDYLKMAEEFNRATQFPRSQLDVPLWTTSELGKLVFQFRRFIYRQSQMLQREVLNEAQTFFRTGGKDGSLRPLLVWATAWPAAGYAVMWARDRIAGREREDDPFLKTLAEAISWVGGFGILEEVARLFRGDPREAIVEVLGGPSVRLAWNIAEAVQGLGRAGLGAVAGEEEQTRRGLAQAARGAVRLLTPTSVGFPLAAGNVPGARLFVDEEQAEELAQPVRRIFQPDRYDPTGRLRAQQTFEKHMERIGRGFIEWQINRLNGRNDPTPYIEALKEAQAAGLALSRSDVMNLLQRPTFQLEVLKQMERRVKDPVTRQYLKLQLQRLEYQMELERLQRVPEAARPLMGR